MQSSVRIARVDVGHYRLLTSDFAGLQALHRELTATIRRHLPGVTASLLALPIPSDDGVTVDWYSDLGGQPQPLAALPAKQRALVREKLQDRLGSIQRLADDLPRRLRGSEPLAERLRAATHYPGDEHLFAVGDEPVLTLWGFVRSSGGGRLATPAQAGIANQRRRWLLGLGLAALSMIALAGGGWYTWMSAREQGFRDDLAAALASDCADADRLAVLDHRLQQLDPEGRLTEPRRQIGEEQQHCAQVAALHKAIVSAGWDCAALEALPPQLALLDPARASVQQLTGALNKRISVCDRSTRLANRFEQQIGNCEAIAALAQELTSWPEAKRLHELAMERSASPDTALNTAYGNQEGRGSDGLPEPLARLRERIDTELGLCASAATLADEITAASAQCEPLLRLDGRLSELDASGPPLLPVRERLDAELARCARAEAFSRDLINAQMDCSRLKALDERMQGEDTSQPPLLPVRERLDQALEQCRALDALQQSLQDAGQDCDRLADLAETVRDAHPNNPIFVKLRRRIAGETQRCELTERLRAALAAASGDCDALSALAPSIQTQDSASPSSPDPRGSDLRDRLEAELALCADADNWRQRLARVGADCKQIDALRAALPKAAANTGQFSDVVSALSATEERCRSAAIAAAEAARSRQARRGAITERATAPAATMAAKASARPAADTKTPAKRRCPGNRATAETPQLVMVFDASGSMGHGINVDDRALRQLQQMGDTPLGAAIGLLGGLLGSAVGGPSRMQAAKDAGRGIVGQLPSDVDVGLVKIEDCPGATNAGFYPPARRRVLLGQINALQPRQDTPLASAIAQAASMVDGVNRPGVIAVISDGEDTCGGDVCGTAARIARAKPKLKINVVDIAGMGGANCAASATGGRVLRAGNAAELNAQLQRATEEVRGPAECRGG